MSEQSVENLHVLRDANAPKHSTIEPQNLDAEESVLGAMMLNPVAIDLVGATALEEGDFYRESHRLIFRAILALSERREPVDSITVAHELELTGRLAAVPGGHLRVHELFGLVPSTLNAGHYAGIVRDLAVARRQASAATKYADDRRAGLAADPTELLAALAETAASVPLPGLSHEELLALDLDDAEHLIDGLLPAGIVASIVGLPETGKSVLAAHIAFHVASGIALFGRPVAQAAVGVWIQDGSHRATVQRLQRLAASFGPTLPIRWHVAAGARVPEHLDAIRREVEQEGQRLVLLDSAYNFLQGGLKDEEAAQALQAIKDRVADPTGATVLVIDHSPWPNESNSGQRRAYGSVFKSAATRTTWFVTRDDDDVTVRVKGNDVADQTLELKLGEDLSLTLAEPVEPVEKKAPAEAIAAFIKERGTVTPGAIKKEFGIGDTALIARRERLAELGILYVSEGRESRYEG